MPVPRRRRGPAAPWPAGSRVCFSAEAAPGPRADTARFPSRWTQPRVSPAIRAAGSVFCLSAHWPPTAVQTGVESPAAGRVWTKPGHLRVWVAPRGTGRHQEGVAWGPGDPAAARATAPRPEASAEAACRRHRAEGVSERHRTQHPGPTRAGRREKPTSFLVGLGSCPRRFSTGRGCRRRPRLFLRGRWSAPGPGRLAVTPVRAGGAVWGQGRPRCRPRREWVKTPLLWSVP